MPPPPRGCEILHQNKNLGWPCVFAEGQDVKRADIISMRVHPEPVLGGTGGGAGGGFGAAVDVSGAGSGTARPLGAMLRMVA